MRQVCLLDNGANFIDGTQTKLSITWEEIYNIGTKTSFLMICGIWIHKGKLPVESDYKYSVA
jgi:hypothetical protein